MAENLLNREFHATQLNEKWVSDITYVATEGGWLYVAGILDLEPVFTARNPEWRAIITQDKANHRRNNWFISR